MERVAPLAGAWIEIPRVVFGIWWFRRVAPLAGAWIEITCADTKLVHSDVAPLAGAWIEIGEPLDDETKELCRSPRGSVD